jgi:hypothetical protein
VLAVSALLPQLWLASPPDPGPALVNSRYDRQPGIRPAPTPTPVATTQAIEPAPDETITSPSPGTAATPAILIKEVLWTDTERTTVVSVEADGPLDEAAVGHFLMRDEPQPRLVLYLYGIGSAGLAYRTEVDGERLDAIRVWYHQDKTPVQLHIVFDLAHEHVVASPPAIDGGRLVITLTSGEEAVSPQ